MFVMERPTTEVEVAVVGGGVAGLSCAAALSSARKVCVLEADDRLGGRIKEERGLDVGAAWVHGTKGNPVAEHSAVNPALIEVTKTNPYSHPKYEHHGVWLPSTAASAPALSVKEDDFAAAKVIFSAVQALVSEQADRCTSTLLPVLPTLEDAMVECKQWRDAPTVQRRLVDWMFWQHANWMGAGLHMLPLTCFGSDEFTAETAATGGDAGAEEQKAGGGAGGEEAAEVEDNETYGDYPGAHCAVKGGMSTLVTALADGLDVRLGFRATEVRQRPDGRVHVQAKSGDIVVATAVVLALPVPVLRGENGLLFTPPLPEPKLTALSRIGVGTENKVMLWFDECWWPSVTPFHVVLVDDERSGGGDTVLFRMWIDYHKIKGVPALVAPLVGLDAVNARNMRPKAVIQAAMDSLASVFGSCPRPAHTLVTSWETDELSLGAYSYPSLGSVVEDHEALAKPLVKRGLFFAGEACDAETMGSVPGALLSGQRAASEAEQYLRELTGK